MLGDASRTTRQTYVRGFNRYLNEHDVRVRYLHSDIDTAERVEIFVIFRTF